MILARRWEVLEWGTYIREPYVSTMVYWRWSNTVELTLQGEGSVTRPKSRDILGFRGTFYHLITMWDGQIIVSLDSLKIKGCFQCKLRWFPVFREFKYSGTFALQIAQQIDFGKLQIEAPVSLFRSDCVQFSSQGNDATRNCVHYKDFGRV